MAHTFDTSAKFDSALDPATASYTVGTGGTVLTVGIVTKRGGGTSPRAGGAPTYDGNALTQAGLLQAATETECELWYLIGPTTGSSLTVSVPNTGTEDLHIHVSSAISATGTSAFDVEAGAAQTSSSVDAVATAANVTTVDGDYITDIAGTGHAQVPASNSQTLINSTDEGQYSSSSQYALQASLGSITFSWTMTANDDWCIQTASFKEGGGATPRTKTLSADSLLQKQDILLTASADSLLQLQGIEKTLSADALLIKIIELTLSADALLRKDGIETTFLADALLAKLGIERTVSADALLVSTVEKTLSADALLQATVEKTFSADALLQILDQTVTTEVDALLQKAGIEVTTSADALLLKHTILTLSADALLRKLVEKTLSADALLQKALILTLSADALLVTTVEKTLIADALLQKLVEITLSADALLQKAGVAATVSADAVLNAAAAGGRIMGSLVGPSGLIGHKGGLIQ